MNSNTHFILFFNCRLSFWGILNKLGCLQVRETNYCFCIFMREPKGTPWEPQENTCRIRPESLQTPICQKFSEYRILTSYAYKNNIYVPQALQQI
jgi:hypothetical protein